MAKNSYISDNTKRICYILMMIKCWYLLQNTIYPQPIVDHVNVTNKLETVYDISSESFKILDLENVSHSLLPHGSCEKVNIVLLILSAPKNIHKREMLRTQFRKV